MTFFAPQPPLCPLDVHPTARASHSDHPTGCEKRKSLNGAALLAKKLAYRGEHNSVTDIELTRLTLGRFKSTACGQNTGEEGKLGSRETGRRPINGLEGGPTARGDCSLQKKSKRASAPRADEDIIAPRREASAHVSHAVGHACFENCSRIGTASTRF